MRRILRGAPGEAASRPWWQHVLKTGARKAASSPCRVTRWPRLFVTWWGVQGLHAARRDVQAACLQAGRFTHQGDFRLHSRNTSWAPGLCLVLVTGRTQRKKMPSHCEEVHVPLSDTG